MSWFRRIALILSISSFLIFAIALTLNWAQGPGIENLAGEVKSSDLLQHYGAGTFVREGRAGDLYREGTLGLWLYRQHPKGEELKKSSFNYVYPPVVATLLSPFTVIPFLPLALLWLALSLFFYLVSSLQLLSFNRPRDLVFPLLLLLGLPSFSYNLILGQNSCVSFLIITSSALLLHRKLEFTAGLVLSCLFYKPQFLPLLAGFMLIAGHWRFVIAAVLGSLVWLALGLLVCGIDSYRAWLEVLQNLNNGEQLQFAHLNQTLKMFVLNLLGQASHPGKIAGLLTTLLGLAVLAWSAFLVRRGKALREWSPAHALLLAACVMTIASPYLMHYDLLLGAGWWLLCLMENEEKGWKPQFFSGLFWLVSLFSINTGNWAAPATAPLMLLYLAGTIGFYFKGSCGKFQNSKPAQM